jgi:hypothetical protein
MRKQLFVMMFSRLVASTRVAARAASRTAARSTRTSPVATGSLLRSPSRARDSTTFSRTFAAQHDDFAPISNVAPGVTIDDSIAKDVADNNVMLYMKGEADAPQCGFSNQVGQVESHSLMPHIT